MKKKEGRKLQDFVLKSKREMGTFNQCTTQTTGPKGYENANPIQTVKYLKSMHDLE